MDVQEATTELPDSVKLLSNTTILIKTYVSVLLARPALINSSATQSFGGGHFPPESNDASLPCLLSPSLFSSPLPPPTPYIRSSNTASQQLFCDIY